MRNNREKWQFYDHPSKPMLTSSEVSYWKELMKKLLKVGLEFEFNLANQKGKCKGDNIQCPCIFLDKKCWQDCQADDKCHTTPCYDTCVNHHKKCEAKKCVKCKSYKFRCLGVTCVEFLSKCFKCDAFDQNCDICNSKYKKDQDPAVIRDILTREFQPTNQYEKVGPSSVVGITTDGSLLGDKGVEIITIGRRVDFWEFYKMSKKIIDRVTGFGGYINERCGAHAHLLASYYDEAGVNEMEKDMPEIILANFHQLCRRYQNAMTWMTMALDNPDRMTRWEKFRVSILNISPVTKDMKTVISQVAGQAGGNKYGWVNYNKVSFNRDNKIKRFHVEMRVADATPCPTIWAAIACLFYALAIKSVEISRYGLLKVGEEAWLRKAQKMKKAIMNNCSDWNSEDRFSHTEKVLDYKEDYIAESKDMLAQLKGVLLRLGPAYDILDKLAERPVALRRIDGEKWEEIEASFKVEMTEVNQMELKLNEIVDLRLIEDCKSVEEWVGEVSKALDGDEEFGQKVAEADVEVYFTTKMREGEIIWSESTGSMIAL